MDEITGLSGMLDASAFNEGTGAFGTKVSEEYNQIINKLNESITGLNEVAVDQIADEASIEANTSGVSANASDIVDHETRISANEVSVVDHETRIGDNETDIVALQGAIGVGVIDVSTDIASFDYVTYGGYGTINLNSPASKRVVTMPSPGAGGWPEGHRVFLICSANYGAVLDSAYFHPYGAFSYANMVTGDVIMATVVNDASGGGLKWSVALLEKASSKNNCKVMGATESYVLTTRMEFSSFVNATQSSGNVATVTLPEIDNTNVGSVIHAAHVGALGDLRIAAHSGDYILDVDGSDVVHVDLNTNAGNAVAVLFALPNGRWACTMA